MRPASVGYQCPDCLEEARRTGPGRLRSRLVLGGGRGAPLTDVLLGINVVLFIVEVIRSKGNILAITPQAMFGLGGLYPPAVAGGQYWRLISSMFLHEGLIHIAFNMYALYLIGTAIEITFGSVRFLAIYFVSGFLASVTSFVFGPALAVSIGASGAIFGLLGAWTVFNLRRRSNPAAAANLRVAIGLIVINLIITFAIPGIAIFAHIGGLITGGVVGLLLETGSGRTGRAIVQIGGVALIVAIGVVMTAMRVAALTHQGLVLPG